MLHLTMLIYNSMVSSILNSILLHQLFMLLLQLPILILLLQILMLVLLALIITSPSNATNHESNDTSSNCLFSLYVSPTSRGKWQRPLEDISFMDNKLEGITVPHHDLLLISPMVWRKDGGYSRCRQQTTWLH